MFNRQASAITIIQKHRISVSSIKEPVNKNVWFICQIKSFVGFIPPRFYKDDPVNRPADELVNCSAFQFRIPIRADNDAVIIILLKMFLNTADQDRGKGAGNVIDNKTYCKGPVSFETPGSDIGVIAQLVS